MRDRVLVLGGLALFLALVTWPAWRAMASAPPRPPDLARPAGATECVERVTVIEHDSACGDCQNKRAQPFNDALRVGLAELKRRFGVYVAAGPVVFSGFELGADHVAWIAAEEPSFFSRLLLIEPSPSSWPSSRAALFGRAGGQRVLFAFGPLHRDELGQRAVLTSRGGAEARAVFLGEGPVTLEPPSRRLLRQNWSWLAAPGKPHDLENVAGNALPAGGPVAGRPAP